MAKPLFIFPEIKQDTVLIFTLVISDGKAYSGLSTAKVFIKNVIKTSCEIVDEHGIKVYPNPSNGIFRIDGIKGNQQNEIEIYSKNGKLIRQKRSNSTMEMIDISDQVAGVYLLLTDKKAYKIIKK